MGNTLAASFGNPGSAPTEPPETKHLFDGGAVTYCSVRHTNGATPNTYTEYTVALVLSDSRPQRFVLKVGQQHGAMLGGGVAKYAPRHAAH